MVMPPASVIGTAAGIPAPQVAAIPPLRPLPRCDASWPQDFLGFDGQVHGYAPSMSSDDDRVSQFDAELGAAAQEEAVIFDSLDDLLADLDDDSGEECATAGSISELFTPTNFGGQPSESLRQMRDEEPY